MTLPTVKRRYLSARKGYTALAVFMIVRVVTIARLIYQGRSKEASEASEALDKQNRRFQQLQRELDCQCNRQKIFNCEINNGSQT